MALITLWSGKHLDGTLSVVTDSDTPPNSDGTTHVTFVLAAPDCDYIGRGNIPPTSAGVDKLLEDITKGYLESLTAIGKAKESNGSYYQ